VQLFTCVHGLVCVCVCGYIVYVYVDIVRFVLRMWMCGYMTTFSGEGKLSRLDTLKKLVKVFLVLALSGSTVCVCVCVHNTCVTVWFHSANAGGSDMQWLSED